MKQQQNTSLPAKTILIVDHHGPTLDMLADWLGIAFAESRCLKAQSAEEAISLAAAHAPDVVLMEVQLPRMNGFVAAMCIKTASPRTHVVMMSAHDDLFYREAARIAGTTAYLSKGTLPAELIPLLKSLPPGLGQ